MSDLPELAGSYFADDFVPLEKASLIELADGNAQIDRGVTVQLTGGHTRGHQIVRLESGGASAVCLADMCPTVAHLPTFWTMAYDQFPLTVRREKPAILNDIADHHRIALFSHDPGVTAAQLSQGLDNEWRAAPIAD